ncbi:MAG: tetratricopeptide repeat protein [Acidobacteriia bacterium]|nr:tetratricopeptide repeat protein [Terriglobia bacterium]
MHVAPRSRRRVLPLLVCVAALALPAAAADRARLRVDDYQIEAELQPKTHRLIAHTRVKFTALEDLSVASFELHNALRPTRIADAEGHALSAERITQDNSIRIALPSGLTKDASTTLQIDYEGTLSSGEDSPVQGLKLAYVGDDTSYLLYTGRWFPMSGYGTNRFTATMKITVPAGWTVIGSGAQGSAAATAPARPVKEPLPSRARGRAPAPAPEPQLPALQGGKTFTFVWDKPSFPGTIIAGKFEESRSNEVGLNLRVFFKPAHKDLVSNYTETAAREFQFFTANLGPPLSNSLNIVEIPDDTVPSAWAPEVAAMSSRALSGKLNYRLLANTIAHQWWGADVSPASKSDWWLSDGFARYAEARYVESAAGEAAFNEAIKDLEVGALAYDTVPLSSVGRLDPFAPEFQALVTDKGAIILNMLRWVIGDAAFDKTVRTFLQQYTGKPATVDDFRKIAEQNYGQQLTWFFSQWIDSTGAPEFKAKYTVYRVAKGFRVVGEIAQDLDLFRMPVELKIDTDGQSETKRVEVAGTNSAFQVETFGKPRRIVIDPDNRVLKNSTELKVRASIMRGQGLVEQGDLAAALQEFQKALDANKHSSLAHYRIAEVFFLQKNYQAAANAYRESLNGDGEPRWTEVWSHIQLGKIFDVTGQRDRATNEYRQALQTNDNTQGAMEEARKYLSTPYQRKEAAKEGE